jgi:hypothetical protein
MKSVIYRCCVCHIEELAYSDDLPIGWGSIWATPGEMFNRVKDLCPRCISNWKLKFNEDCPVYKIGGVKEDCQMSKIGDRVIDIEETLDKDLEEITEAEL